MKVAEALIERSDIMKEVAQVHGRLSSNAVVQEGIEPSERIEDIMKELGNLLHRLRDITIAVNHTNIETHVIDTNYTITEALARRDELKSKISYLRLLLDTSNSGVSRTRYSLSEIKSVVAFDVKKCRKELDDLSKQYRELDSKIQMTNWATDLF